MPRPAFLGSARALGAAALLLLLVAPAFAGCLRAADLAGIRTACPGVSTAIPEIPPVRNAFQRVDPREDGRVPPLTTGIRVAILLPPGPTTDVERGFDLAVEQLVEAGADVRVQKTVVASEEPTVVQAALNQTLKGSPGIVVSGLGNVATDAISELARERRITLLAAVADGERLVSLRDTGGYFYRIPWSDATEGRAAAELLWSSGCHSANLIVDGSDHAADLAASFRAAYQEKGGEVARVVTVQRNASNAAAVIDRVQLLQPGDEKFAPRPHAILVIAPPREAAELLREAYRQKVSAKSAFFFTAAEYAPEFVTLAGKDRNGHLLAVGLRGTSPMAAETRATEAFEREHRLRHGLDASNASARAYDAAFVSVLAGVCARSDRPDDLRANLRRVNDADRGDTDVSGADALFAITTATASCSVNYVGASGDYDWSRRGEPATGAHFFWTVTGDGALAVTHRRVEPPPRE